MDPTRQTVNDRTLLVDRTKILTVLIIPQECLSLYNMVTLRPKNTLNGKTMYFI